MNAQRNAKKRFRLGIIALIVLLALVFFGLGAKAGIASFIMIVLALSTGLNWAESDPSVLWRL